MNKKVKAIIFIMIVALLFGIVFNKIFAESTGGTTTDKSTIANQNTVQYLKNIGKPYSGKSYIIGNTDNDKYGKIDLNDATVVLTFVANSLAWDYEKNPVKDDYELFNKLVEKKCIMSNDNIKSVEDLYNIYDVNEDKIISIKDACEILRYYACNSAGIIKD